MIYPISGYFCDIPKWIQMDLCFLNKVWGINFARLNIFINLPPILQVTNWIYYCCCNNNFDKTVSFSLFISILGLSRTSRRPWACGTWRITCRYKIVLCFVKKKKKKCAIIKLPLCFAGIKNVFQLVLQSVKLSWKFTHLDTKSVYLLFTRIIHERPEK